MHTLDSLMAFWAPAGLLVLGLVTVVSLGLFGLGIVLDWGEHRAVREALGDVDRVDQRPARSARRGR